MTKLLLAAALAAAVVVGAWAVFLRGSSEDRGIFVGALEDAPKLPDPALADQGVGLGAAAGFDALNVTTPWEKGRTEPDPTELLELRNVAAATKRRRIRLLLTVDFPDNSDTPLTEEDQLQFAGYAARLARELPSVRDFVIANEPNLNRFWLPQFDASGKDAVAPAYTSLLARSYDELKKVSPEIRVVGGSLAPRGADNPDSMRQTHSPAVFIRDMGLAYRASGRTRPIMDIFAIHPYLQHSDVPPTRSHPVGTSIGIADYDRLVRLLGEAFDGTAQPGSDLPIAYTELGVQSRIPEAAQGTYTNLRSPLGLDAVDEGTQAEYYREAFELASCQPTVVGILIFHLPDETDLDRWQSGVYYADGKPKSSRGPVREAALKARRGELAGCPDD